ncbi:MAG TPA: hypothetical protein VFI02_21250 [Armatimonadota bacterium]|nr:hypothetical protein [Armatimonadota bacterium]
MKASDTKMDRLKATEREIRRQKQREKRGIRAVLELLGYRVTLIRGQEKPDTIVYVSKDGTKSKIGIEHTSYVVDALHGKESQGMGFYELWRKVSASIKRRLSHIPEVESVDGWVRFCTDVVPPHTCCRPLAAELIALAREFPMAQGEEKEFCRRLKYEPRTKKVVEIPTHYPLLRQYVEEVTLLNTGCHIRLWTCRNTSASHVGLSRRHIAEIITAYNGKAARYVWGNVDERWLIIAASGSPIFTTADPYPQWFEWDCPEIKVACTSLSFDRIYFWGGRFDWCKEIYPGAPIVQKEWRT